MAGQLGWFYFHKQYVNQQLSSLQTEFEDDGDFIRHLLRHTDREGIHRLRPLHFLTTAEHRDVVDRLTIPIPLTLIALEPG
jgi:hypothetical protein